MRIGVIGINHKLADLKLRESFARLCQRRFCPGGFTHHEHSLVTLSTCNRAEVYFSSENLADSHSYLLKILREDMGEVPEMIDQKLYSYFGEECFEHLARVTAGLDSAIVAETEIQGQVKLAYEHATEHLQLPPELHFLFQKSLKIGKEVRGALPIARGMPDLEHAILNTGYHVFGEPEEAKILFIGASEINRKVIAFLQRKNMKNITLCNRSREGAENMANKCGLKILDWERMQEWHSYDWIIFGTKASDFLVTKKEVAGKEMGHKLLIDLSVPRNVEPKLGRDPRVTLLNIDQLNRMLNNRRDRMQHLITQAEELVNNSTKKQVKLFTSRQERKLQLLECA